MNPIFYGALCVCVLAFVRHVQAQGPGRGISKSTYAASDPIHTTYPWFMKYLPVADADDSCPDNLCTCGACGRVALKTTVDGSDGVSFGFGIHTVLAAGADGSRAAASGNYSVAAIEAIFDEKVGPAIAGGKTIDPYMDINTGLFVADLSEYTTPFKNDNVPYFPIILNGTDGTQYPSLYVHVPKSQVTFLISATSTGADKDAHWTDGTAHSAEGGHILDFTGYGGQPPVAVAGLAYPLHVSRSVADVGEIEAFYKTVFNQAPTLNYSLEDGGKLISYTLTGSTVPIVFIERPAGSTGEHSAAWLQQYFNDVAAKYQTSYKSCWPIWGDNHYAFDTRSGITGDQMIKVYEANKGKTGFVYHMFKTPRGSCNGYFGDPSGWQFQYDAQFTDCPSDSEAFNVNYCTTSCEA